MDIAVEIAENSYILVHECAKYLVQELEKGNLITEDGSKYNPEKGYNFSEILSLFLVDRENKDIQLELPNLVLEWVCWQLGKKNCSTFRVEQTRPLVRKLMMDNANKNLVFMLFNLIFKTFYTAIAKDK